MKHIKSLSAFCLFLIISSALFIGCKKDDGIPDPKAVQTANPLMEVASLKQMEKYLDFTVPVLDKEVDRYIVLVIDGYPTMGRIQYVDGGIFNIQYGTGDISGIYGGTYEKLIIVGGPFVSFYSYEDTYYAIWENDGFTHSLSNDNLKLLEREVSELLLDYVPWK